MDLIRFAVFIIIAVAMTKVGEDVFFNWRKDDQVEDFDHDQYDQQSVFDEDQEPDDLTIIGGIKPDMIPILEDAGYVTFSDIELANMSDLKRTIETSFPGVGESELRLWSKQASYAVQGRMEELEQLKAKMARARMRRLVQ